MKIFNYGPTGRAIKVDDKGRLIVNAGEANESYVFGYGDTGRHVAVDGNGRLLVNAIGLSGVGGGSGVTEQQLIDASGALRIDITALQAASGEYYEKNSDVIPPEDNTYNVGSEASRFEIIFASSGNFASGVQIGEGSFHLSPNGDLSIPGTTVNVADIGTGTVDTSGLYKKDEDLIPASGSTYDIGSSTSGLFNTIYSHKMDATSGLFDVVEVGVTTVIDGSPDGDVSCLYLEKTSGGEPIIDINNNGSCSGYDFHGSSGNVTMDKYGTIIAVSGRFLDGLQIGSGSFHLNPNGDLSIPGTKINIEDVYNDIASLQAVSGGGLTKYTEVINSWSPSGELYYYDVTHSLGSEDIITKYLNNNTKESIGIEKDQIIDSNTIRVFVTSTAIPVKIIAL